MTDRYPRGGVMNVGVNVHGHPYYEWHGLDDRYWTDPRLIAVRLRCEAGGSAIREAQENLDRPQEHIEHSERQAKEFEIERRKQWPDYRQEYQTPEDLKRELRDRVDKLELELALLKQEIDR